MFSKNIENIERNISKYQIETISISDLRISLETKSSLSLHEIVQLMILNASNRNIVYEEILNKSFNTKINYFNNTIFPVVPVYVSSICQENCKYCNFRAANKINVKRIRLTDTEVHNEIEYLVSKKGYRTIELVYASDPTLTSDDISNHIKITRKILNENGGGQIGLNAEPFEIDDYKKFKDSSLDFAVIWQETYQKKYYTLFHTGITKKADFYSRLDAIDKIIAAGIYKVGLGILSGLAPWKEDWLMLIGHEKYLVNKYGIRPSILGIPRLKPAKGGVIKTTSFIPNDEEFLYAISLHNLLFPTSLPFVNTRENWNLCLKIAKGGGVLFTFDCSTFPSGYTSKKQEYQFPTFNFELEQYINLIKKDGFKPIFNWHFDLVDNPNNVKDVKNINCD